MSSPRKRAVGVRVFVALALSAGSLSAQAPSAAPPFDELDRERMERVIDAAKLANDTCAGLKAVKDFEKLRDEKTAQIEAKHPGYRLDWTTRALVAKPQAGSK